MTSDHSDHSARLLDVVAVLWCVQQGDDDAGRFLANLYADDPWPLVRLLAKSLLLEVASHHQADVPAVLASTRRLLLELELGEDPPDDAGIYDT
jgi:hypothetical protein